MREMTIEDRALMRRLAMGLLTERAGSTKLDEFATTLLFPTEFHWRSLTTSLETVRDATRTLLPGWEHVSGLKQRGYFAYVNNGELLLSAFGNRSNPKKRWYEHVAATEPLACTAVLLLAVADLGGAKRETTPKEGMFRMTFKAPPRQDGRTVLYVAAKSGQEARDNAGLTYAVFVDHHIYGDVEPVLVRTLAEVPEEDRDVIFDNQGDCAQSVSDWFRERAL